MPCGSGESSEMIQDSKELIVPFFGMKAESVHRSLSDKLMRSLVSSGLVRGIIPMSMRRKSEALTPDFVFSEQVGDDAV